MSEDVQPVKVHFRCDRCAKRLTASVRLDGKQGRCSGCGRIVQIPSESVARNDPRGTVCRAIDRIERVIQKPPRDGKSFNSLVARLVSEGESAVLPLLWTCDRHECDIEFVIEILIEFGSVAIAPLVQALENIPDLAGVARRALDELGWKPVTEEQRVRYAFAEWGRDIFSHGHCSKSPIARRFLKSLVDVQAGIFSEQIKISAVLALAEMEDPEMVGRLASYAAKDFECASRYVLQIRTLLMSSAQAVSVADLQAVVALPQVFQEINRWVPTGWDGDLLLEKHVTEWELFSHEGDFRDLAYKELVRRGVSTALRAVEREPSSRLYYAKCCEMSFRGSRDGLAQSNCPHCGRRLQPIE